MKEQYEPKREKSKLERFIERYGKDWREMFIGSKIMVVSEYNACYKTEPIK